MLVGINGSPSFLACKISDYGTATRGLLVDGWLVEVDLDSAFRPAGAPAQAGDILTAPGRLYLAAISDAWRGVDYVRISGDSNESPEVGYPVWRVVSDEGHDRITLFSCGA